MNFNRKPRANQNEEDEFYPKKNKIEKKANQGLSNHQDKRKKKQNQETSDEQEYYLKQKKVNSSKTGNMFDDNEYTKRITTKINAKKGNNSKYHKESINQDNKKNKKVDMIDDDDDFGHNSLNEEDNDNFFVDDKNVVSDSDDFFFDSSEENKKTKKKETKTSTKQVNNKIKDKNQSTKYKAKQNKEEEEENGEMNPLFAPKNKEYKKKLEDHDEVDINKRENKNSFDLYYEEESDDFFVKHKKGVSDSDDLFLDSQDENKKTKKKETKTSTKQINNKIKNKNQSTKQNKEEEDDDEDEMNPLFTQKNKEPKKNLDDLEYYYNEEEDEEDKNEREHKCKFNKKNAQKSEHFDSSDENKIVINKTKANKSKKKKQDNSKNSDEEDDAKNYKSKQQLLILDDDDDDDDEIFFNKKNANKSKKKKQDNSKNSDEESNPKNYKSKKQIFIENKDDDIFTEKKNGHNKKKKVTDISESSNEEHDEVDSYYEEESDDFFVKHKKGVSDSDDLFFDSPDESKKTKKKETKASTKQVNNKIKNKNQSTKQDKEEDDDEDEMNPLFAQKNKEPKKNLDDLEYYYNEEEEEEERKAFKFDKKKIQKNKDKNIKQDITKREKSIQLLMKKTKKPQNIVESIYDIKKDYQKAFKVLTKRNNKELQKYIQARTRKRDQESISFKTYIEIDMHGSDPRISRALDWVPIIRDSLFDALDCNVDFVCFITGKGLHSDPNKGPVLRPLVLLTTKRLEFYSDIDPQNRGVVVCDISSYRQTRSIEIEEKRHKLFRSIGIYDSKIDMKDYKDLSDDDNDENEEEDHEEINARKRRLKAFQTVKKKFPKMPKSCIDIIIEKRKSKEAVKFAKLFEKYLHVKDPRDIYKKKGKNYQYNRKLDELESAEKREKRQKMIKMKKRIESLEDIYGLDREIIERVVTENPKKSKAELVLDRICDEIKEDFYLTFYQFVEENNGISIESILDAMKEANYNSDEINNILNGKSMIGVKNALNVLNVKNKITSNRKDGTPKLVPKIEVDLRNSGFEKAKRSISRIMNYLGNQTFSEMVLRFAENNSKGRCRINQIGPFMIKIAHQNGFHLKQQKKKNCCYRICITNKEKDDINEEEEEDEEEENLFDFNKTMYSPIRKGKYLE